MSILYFQVPTSNPRCSKSSQEGWTRGTHPSKSCLASTEIETVAGKKVLGMFNKIVLCFGSGDNEQITDKEYGLKFPQNLVYETFLEIDQD